MPRASNADARDDHPHAFGLAPPRADYLFFLYRRRSALVCDAIDFGRRRRIHSRQAPELRWAQSHVALEEKRQVALIRESADQRDFSQTACASAPANATRTEPCACGSIRLPCSGCICGTGAIDARSARQPRRRFRPGSAAPGIATPRFQWRASANAGPTVE